jgi:antirestriction protein ArdC
MQKVRNDLHERITLQIIEAIEAGAGDYQMPWNTAGSSASLPQNPVGKYQYHGINVLSLWASQQLRTFTSGQWATYRQWQSIGAQVRQGETGSATVFYQPIIAGDQSNSANDSEESASHRGSRPFILKMATVFNANQVDGFHPETVDLPAGPRHELAERVIKESGARILWGGDKACYLPTRDEIHLPTPEAFVSSEAYYGVTFHELVHWTGHPSRCVRDLSGKFGSAAYAMEELVAELGASFISAETGIDTEPRTDHVSYIKTWLEVLQRDHRAVFFAAAQASMAAQYLSSRHEQFGGTAKGLG